MSNNSPKSLFTKGVALNYLVIEGLKKTFQTIDKSDPNCQFQINDLMLVQQLAETYFLYQDTPELDEILNLEVQALERCIEAFYPTSFIKATRLLWIEVENVHSELKNQLQLIHNAHTDTITQSAK